jgi:hypothetical protein
MIVESISREDKDDYRSAYDIKIDGEEVFSIWEGEPEDATLSRDMNDVYSIPSLMQRAYDAGKAGESFTIVNSEVDW